MPGAEILFVDVPYGRCKIIDCVCSNSDCRVCCIPIVMREEARKIIHDYMY